jgi:hypothetical protein
VHEVAISDLFPMRHCPGPEGNADDATWVTIARGAAVRGRSTGSATLAVRGFDVPSVVLTAPEHELGSEAHAVLDRVRHASAHIFGRSRFNDATAGTSHGPWMRVYDGLVGGEYPFDALLLFDDGDVVAEAPS